MSRPLQQWNNGADTKWEKLNLGGQHGELIMAPSSARDTVEVEKGIGDALDRMFVQSERAWKCSDGARDKRVWEVLQQTK